MIEQRGIRSPAFFLALSRATALTVGMVGLSVLAGWVFGVPALMSVLPGLATMKGNTAACFVLAGLALWVTASDDRPPWRRRLSMGCTVPVALVAGLTIVEYLVGLNFGIDQVLFRDLPGMTSRWPGRMAPASALCFLLLASAIALLDSRRGRFAAQYLALATALLSLLALIGYAYGVDSLYQIFPYSSVALHTAISFFVMSAGVFVARPRDALMAIVTNHGAGGAVARRLLPAAILVPFLIGWVQLAGQRAGLYGTEFGLALYALSNMVVLSALTWWLAGQLHRSDLARRLVAVGLDDALETLRALFDASPVAIAAIDLEERVLAWNPAAERMFGWSRSEILGGLLPSVPRGEETGAGRLRDTVFRGESVHELEAVRLRKDGSSIPVSLSAAPLYDSARRVRGGIAVFADITERRLFEERMRQSQKLEAVGRLAGGVAHDFNNLLTVIGGCVELTLLSLPAESPFRKNLEEAGKASRRAADLTNQLLAFSRKQVLEPKILDLNEILRGMEKMLARLIGEDVVLSFSCAGNLGRVRADRGQIEQVIMNLAINARDAMPRGGRLLIETCDTHLDGESTARQAAAPPGSYVLLAVSDTGSGMSPEIQAQIFEPFFTTKEMGKGTGLGLSTVYGIVKQSGGHIWVYSEMEKGTTFKVYLPKSEGKPEASAATTPVIVPTGRETVLLVEDDDLVRDVIRRMLSGLGYTVIVATGGEEAISLCERQAGALDLLMTDVVMPRLNGRQVAERVSLIRPGLKVLYISGYTDDAIVKLGMLETGLAFLHKPFSQTAVGRKVREVLDQEPRRAESGAA